MLLLGSEAQLLLEVPCVGGHFIRKKQDFKKKLLFVNNITIIIITIVRISLIVVVIIIIVVVVVAVVVVVMSSIIVIIIALILLEHHRILIEITVAGQKVITVMIPLNGNVSSGNDRYSEEDNTNQNIKTADK